jgi:hydroxypyruvate reductase
MPGVSSAPVAALRDLYAAAVRAADPGRTLPSALPEKPQGRCVVVGAGKAAARMAQVVDMAWPDVTLSGIVVTRHGHAVPAGRIDVLQAGHPVPDSGSEVAARRILAAVSGLTDQDLVLFLASGGGSAVMALPAPGLTLADKQHITAALLRSGASITEMNQVRRRLSNIKGGRLAEAASPARVVTLAISDVPGDDPATIASGPTVADTAGTEAVDDILRRYQIELPPQARSAISRRPPSLPSADFRLIASPMMALRRACEVAREAGLQPLILGDALEGEAREVGRVLAGVAISCRTHAVPVTPPCVLLSGGETTVTLGEGGCGRGGRNTELLAALALQLDGAGGIWALAADTDGIDGTEDAAGATIEPRTLARARAAGLDVRAMLARHDSYSLFASLGDLVLSGPTLTNVNDFRAILPEPPPRKRHAPGTSAAPSSAHQNRGNPRSCQLQRRHHRTPFPHRRRCLPPQFFPRQS